MTFQWFKTLGNAAYFYQLIDKLSAILEPYINVYSKTFADSFFVSQLLNLALDIKEQRCCRLLQWKACGSVEYYVYFHHGATGTNKTDGKFGLNVK